MASQVGQNPPEFRTFGEWALGPDWKNARWLQPFWRLEPGRRAAAAAALLGAILYLPYLGAVGLWDPWETHYGEVARMMIQRGDYVHPYWENAWFFSKPPLTMWMDALGMQVVGTLRTPGALGLYTEWGMRVPFALFSILALALLALAVARIANMRAALASAFALGTMPMYWLLTRQTVTDTPFVCALICAMSCALVGQLDSTTRHRAGWWYAFYFFCALATLAKGLLGAGLPAIILLAYALLCVIPYDAESLAAHGRWLASRQYRAEVRQGRRSMPVLWEQLYRMKLLTGSLVFLAACAPWYAKLSLFQGVDDEGKTFWERFIIHDHFSRLASGVHTTTPGGSFTYFIEQGGYAMFPWIALIPGALAVAARVRLRGGDRQEHLSILALLWTCCSFAMVAFSATKFHHYVFPVLPGAAVLIGLYVDRLWEEGVPAHAVSFLIGLLLFALVGKDLVENPKDFTDLFVYNYDRPYPADLVNRPISFLGMRALWSGDLLALLLLLVGGFLCWEAFRAKAPAAGQRATALGLALAGAAIGVSLFAQGRVAPELALGVALAVPAVLLGWEGRRAGQRIPAVAVAVGLLALGLVVQGARARPSTSGLFAALAQPINVKASLGVAFGLAGGLCALAAAQRSRPLLFGTFWALAFTFALWFNVSHWVSLSHHWTQRDQFWRYYRLRKPDEPIAAYLMNWRGETFYSRNTVKQIKENGMMSRYADLPGRKWALVEHNRLNLLKNAVGADKTVTSVDPGLNNKFVLVTIE